MNHDNLHRIATEHYIREVEKAFQRLISQTASAVVKTKLKKELFQFKKNPKITERINQILSEYENSLLGIISTGSARQWNFANEKYNYLKALTLKRIANKIPKEVFQKELLKVAANTQNARALLSFQQRKTNGFTLSDRVWNITKQAKEELELAIDLSLTEGQSANTLARAIRKHLNNPNSLYKKIKDKHGNSVLSNNTEYYHVGQGVYRSAYKNAMRLARNEINTAYRTSEQLRIEQNNDIVGVEIHLSSSHKIYDMCDELKGVYPKDFKWDKWHVNCMCHRRTIMKTDAEFIRELKNGENLPPETSENFVADVPKQYKDWIKENEDKMQNWKRKPEFMERNEKYWNTNLENRVSDLIEKAKASDKEVSNVLFKINKDLGGYSTPINIKSRESILRKAKGEFGGNVEEIKDSIRATVILPKEKIKNISEYLKKMPIFERVKIQTPENYSGYSGILSNIKTKNGIYAEIQFNTDKMIYAKEKPSDAIRIIGEKRWQEINREVGLEGGLGHKYYEEIRVLKAQKEINIDDLVKIKELEKLSFNYYNNFR